MHAHAHTDTQTNSQTETNRYTHTHTHTYTHNESTPASQGSEVAIALMVSEPMVCTMLLNFSIPVFVIS